MFFSRHCSRYSFVLFFIATALIAQVLHAEAQISDRPNLAPNPGFETADGDGPAFWGQRTPTDAERTLAWDAGTAHSGARCLRIDSRTAAPSRWRTGHLYDLALKPGTDCDLSAWIKPEDVEGGAHLRLYFMGTDNGIVAQPDSTAVVGTSEWTEARLHYTVPEGTAYVMIYLELHGAGTAWYDDVVLHGAVGEVPDETARKPTAYGASDFAVLDGFEVVLRKRREVLQIPQPGGEGRAEMTFWGESARYDVTVAYLDESDGNSALRVLINGQEIAQWQFDETPLELPAKDIARTKTIPGVDIQRLSRITVEGTADEGECCRVHEIAFTPTGRYDGEFLPHEQLDRVPTLRIYEDPPDQQRARGMLPRYIEQGAERVSAAREQELAALKTPEQWRERQARTRARLPEFLGEFGPKCPLNARITGKLDRPGYVIEKVVFESQPQFYCTANLYVPKRCALPAPGIIFTCGHAKEGKAYHLYHEACLGFVLKGYVVLALDPIGQGERLEYYDPENGEDIVGPCVSQHHYLGRPAWLVGRSLAGYRTWDCIRALDYLVTQPEVDPEQIGAVGNSGGGQMALLITAADERVKVCAAAHPGGSMENSYLAGQGVIDKEVLSLIPPRPCAFIVGEESGEDHHSRRLDDMLRFYEGLGVGKERGRLFLVDGVHNMKQPKREAAYAWLNQWFGKETEGAQEPPLEPETVEDLNCTPSGCVLRDLAGESGQTLNAKMAAQLRPQRLMPKDENALDATRAQARSAIAERVGLRLPEKTEPPACGTQGRFQAQDFDAEKLEIETEPGIVIPSLLLTPKRTPPEPPLVVHLAEQGKPSNPTGDSLALALVRMGFTVLSVDVRGVGETDPRGRARLAPLTQYDARQWRLDSCAINAAYLGTTMLAMRAFDAIRVLDYVATREDLDAQPIVLVGEGLGGVWALVAAAFDPRPAGVICAGTIPSYQLVVDSHYYACRGYFWVNGALKDFDLPELIALVAPRPVALVNPVDAMLDSLPTARCRDLCAWTSAVYDVLNAPDGLHIIEADTQKPTEFAQRIASELPFSSPEERR